MEIYNLRAGNLGRDSARMRVNRFKLSGIVLFLLLANSAVSFASSDAYAKVDIGSSLPVWAIIPFAGMLLSIAIGPLLVPRFWHNHFGKVSIFWSLLFALPFLFFYGSDAVYEINHIVLVDYLPFIILLWGLFVISGGIVISGSLQDTPLVNLILLLLGTLLSSLVGTTGASMVMIRPVLRVNRKRIRKAHIICFFIFLISNIGGALTPLGDPPLFLGFLHNVPFFWVTINLLPSFLFTAAVLLGLFYMMDYYFYRKEIDFRESGPEEKVPFRIRGSRNFILLAGVMGVILISGHWKPGEIKLFGVYIAYQNLLRDLTIIALGLVSLWITKIEIRKENDFSWGPIKEVAKLFAGIFITIIPALAILRAGSQGAFAELIEKIQSPASYFWASGMLSSFLDNAPAYLAFFNMALGKLGLLESQIPAALSTLGIDKANAAFIGYLKAISAGCVFMGANTYLGNAPNFMVKSIAEEAGINMPSFFGYIFKYSIPILIPVFTLVTLFFI
jgi:Na+/H+ antiporter NhaD/arsenite permease-like protein